MGSKLTEPQATTFENTDSRRGRLSLLGTADNAPDDGGGKAWTVADCATTGPTAARAASVVQAGKLDAHRAGRRSARRKKAKKGKTVKVALSGKATDVEATLHKGAFSKPKVYGKGKLAARRRQGEARRSRSPGRSRRAGTR